MSRVRFLPAAYHDIRAAYEWCEAQLVAHRSTRRCLLERFPFCLFYREERGELLVIACLHTARDPELRDLRLDD